MAVNFTIVPTRVIPFPPKWNTDITPSDRFKKQYLSLAPTPEQRFKLIFEKMSDANYNALIAHYNSCKGGWDNFLWTTVPSYVDTDLDGTIDGTNMTGRWEEGSISEPVVNAYDMGDIEIIFIKDI
jgi:hypothetical protein